MPYARIEIPADWSLCPRARLLQGGKQGSEIDHGLVIAR
jgi:hypothetical protein